MREISRLSGVSSKDKWLSLHTGKHWESFYLPQYVAAQKKFFNCFLRGEPNGWDEPRVKIVVRDPRGERLRTADQFPLPTTKPIRYYLDTRTKSLASTKPIEEGEIAYDALGPGVDFSTEPFIEDVEFTGFVSAHLWAMSSTDDMDIFAVLRAVGPDGEEFISTAPTRRLPYREAGSAVTPKNRPERTNSLRMFHAHDEIQKIVLGKPIKSSWRFGQPQWSFRKATGWF